MQNLEKKLKINEERLKNLLTKRANLDEEIKHLERKIQNQRNTLMNLEALEKVEL